MSQTQTILATTVYGQASGNYDGSSQDWYSDPAQAADYYRGRGGLQTVTFSLDQFEGRIVEHEGHWNKSISHGDTRKKTSTRTIGADNEICPVFNRRSAETPR